MTLWRKYSFGITVAVLFLAAWAFMTWADWIYFVAQQADHHQPADVFGASGYIWRWGTDTFSNWQADLLGQSLAVIFGGYLLFWGSEESSESSEQVQSMVQDIERQVRGPEAATRAQRAARGRIYPGPWWRNYTLGYVMFGAFIVTWALMTWMGWMHFASNAQEHGQTATVFGTGGYIWEWARETFSNWQSDALGHGLLIVVPAYLLYKGSAQSRESMDRIHATVHRIQAALQGKDREAADPGSTIRETRPIRTSPQPLKFWKKYGLGIAFLTFFLVSWVLQTWTGWGYFVNQQLEHHSPADVFGSSGYVWLWATDTLSNWQSDVLWDGLFILFGAWLVFRGSSESKDGDERIEELANSIERRVRGEEPARQAQRESDRRVSFGGVWRNKGLAYSLLAGGIVSWALMTWTGWMNFAANQAEHHTTAQVFGASGYAWDWARLTLENWQSDILGNGATLILSAYLLFKGSGLSRGSDDEIEQALERIQQTLQSKPAGRAATAPADSAVQNQTAGSTSRKRS